MFKWVVISFIIILAATYLWPIVAKSGKKTAHTLFDEDAESFANELKVPPTNVIPLHRTNTENPVDFPTQSAYQPAKDTHTPVVAPVVVSEPEHSLVNDSTDNVA